MRADEYDALIENPDGYFRRTFLPRVATSFAPLAAVDPYCDFMEAAALPLNILGYADPAVLEAVKKLSEAALAAIEQFETMGAMAADVGGRLGSRPSGPAW